MEEKLPRKKGYIITIDGPAGSGKSTTARRVAEALGYLYLDTGAMYRAITVKVIRAGISKNRMTDIFPLLEQTSVSLKDKNNSLLVLLDGEDVSTQIRTPEVDREISWVCQIPEVRNRMIALQRKIGKDGGIVAEGRDMGTVVFPDAEFKFFLVASVEERGKRRWLEMKKRGIQMSLEEVTADIIRRDRVDSERKLNPLKKAEDAIVIDTSSLSIDEQTEKIINYIRGGKGKK